MERTQEEINALKAKRQFKKFTWQGIELEALLEVTHAQLATMCRARIRRRFQRGLKRKPMALIKKLRTAKLAMTNPQGKPEAVKVRMRTPRHATMPCRDQHCCRRRPRAHAACR